MIAKTIEKVCNICGGKQFNHQFRSSLYGISPTNSVIFPRNKISSLISLKMD